MGVPTLGILGLPFGSSENGSPRTKSHLDVGLMERHKIYYKGEGGGFPQVQARHGESCEYDFAHGSSQHQKCSNYALTNLLFRFVQVDVNEWLFVILPNPIPEL
jgi:hypothetical protein